VTEDLKTLLKKNQKATALILSAVLVLLLASALAACQVEDFVRVDVPKGVADAVGTEQTVSFSEATLAWEDWIDYVEKESDRFSREIDRQAETVSILRSLGETGIAFGQEAAATLPGGALLSTGLALLGGVFLRRPGDAKKEQKEKEASFRKGLEEGKALALEMIEDARSAD